MKTSRTLSALSLGVLLSVLLQAVAAPANPHVAFVAGGAVRILREGEPFLAFRPVHWGLRWKHVGLSSADRKEDGVRVIESTGKFGPSAICYTGRVAPVDARQIDLEYTLSADQDAQTTLGIIEITVGADAVGKTVVTEQDGSTRTIEGGYGRQGLSKQVAGFAEGKTARLKRASITPHTRFAAIYVTAARPGACVADADTLLVTAIARARNSGAKVVGDTMLDNGQAPIVMEPVRTEIVLARSGTPTVWVLDHDGVRTGEKVPVSNGVLMIDGAKYKTPYYEVDYAEALSQTSQDVNRSCETGLTIGFN